MNPNEKIDVLDLSVRTYNCLMRANITTVGKLFETDIEDLKYIRNLGYRCLEEIIEKKRLFGLPVDKDKEVLETQVPNPMAKKKKTADEMFRELGYKEENENYSICNEKWYRKKEDDAFVTICVDFDAKNVICKAQKFEVPMTFQEVLACAQLIKEMEKSNV